MIDAGDKADAGVSYRQQRRRCNRSGCASCRDGGPGHGPYWYAYWRENGHLRSRYVGKSLPARLEPPAPPVLSVDGAATERAAAKHGDRVDGACAPTLGHVDGRRALAPSGMTLAPIGDEGAPAHPHRTVAPGRPTEDASAQGACAPPLRVRTLGAFEVWRGDGVISADAWKHRKALALFTYLIGAPGHRAHRERLVDVLWPEAGGERGAANLRLTVHRLRKLLADRAGREGYIRLEGDFLSLSPVWSGEAPPGWLDVTAFEHAAANALAGRDPGLCRAALARYQGEYLPGELYDEWTAQRREVLRLRYLAVLLHLAELAGARGEAGEAESALRTMLACDPCSEDAACRLMGLLGAAGQRSEALRVYDGLAIALRRELGVSPSTDVLTLRRQLLEQAAASSARLLPQRVVAPRRTNLPVALSSFVGREREVEEVRRRMQGARLLTLTGTGGCGKTRLALQVGERLLSDVPDGVWLVELAAIGGGSENEAAVIRSIAATFGCREETDRPLTETVSAYLADRSLVLVLDNCEHLRDACAVVVARLLAASQSLTVLATSRERLHVPGERLYPVRPLSVPPLDVTIDALPRYEAGALFLSRAGDVSEEELAAPHNARAIAQICVRLAGLPLALELAAARAAALPVRAIAARLDDCFNLLVGGPRTGLPRQRTLRASLEWSYSLMSQAERMLLPRLSVFAGGWTLGSAEAVCACDGSTLDLLQGLVSHSLVQAEIGEEDARYRLLEPVRQYGWEQLRGSGEEAATRDRHLAWCIALAEQAAPALMGPRQLAWIDRLEADHDNLRAALTWARERGEMEAGLRLARALGRFWWITGYYGEGRSWLEWALAGTGKVQPATRVEALDWACNLAESQGEYGLAAELAEECLDLARALGNTAGIVRALNNLGFLAMDRGEYVQAAVLLQESLSLAQTVADQQLTATLAVHLGLLARLQGDHERAAAFLEDGLAAYRTLGDIRDIGVSLLLLGRLHDERGDYARAEASLEESLALARELRSKLTVADALCNLGSVAYHRGDFTRAAGLLVDSLKLSREVGSRNQMADELEALAWVAAARGEPRRAALVGGAAEALRGVLGMPQASHMPADHDRAVQAVRGALGDEAFAASWAEGRALSADRSVALALQTC